MFGLLVRLLERGKYWCNKMAELVGEVEESVVDGFIRLISIQELFRGLKIAKLLR